MSIFTYRDLTKEQVLDAVRLSNAAYAGEAIPEGWRILTPAALGLPEGDFDGIYFRGDGTLGWGDARALPLVSADDTTVALAFRGTDGLRDYPNFADAAFFNNYINAFNPLLDALADLAPSYTRVLFTGHSLGAAAVNQLRTVADTAHDAAFANAYFVAVATPLVSDNGNILNIGFENDWVYKTVELGSDPSHRTDFANATSDLVWYDAGYDRFNLLFDPVDDISAHGIGPGGPYQTAVERIIGSVFYDTSGRGGALPEMSRESAIVVDAFKGAVSDRDTITSDHHGGPAFILGSPLNDVLLGGPASDGIEGGLGNDRIEGGDGRDYLFGGPGANTMLGEGGDDSLSGGRDRDTLNGGPGNDVLLGLEGNDVLLGDSGNDRIFPYTGNDKVTGGDGNDLVVYSRAFAQFDIMSVSVSKQGLVRATVAHAEPSGLDYGVDKLVGVEWIEFSDGFYDLASGEFSPYGSAAALLAPPDTVPST